MGVKQQDESGWPVGPGGVPPGAAPAGGTSNVSSEAASPSNKDARRVYPSAGPGLLSFQVCFFTLPAAGEAGWTRVCGMGGDRRGAGEMSPPKPGPLCAAR